MIKIKTVAHEILGDDHRSYLLCGLFTYNMYGCIIYMYITTCDNNNKMLTDLQVHPEPCTYI